MTKFRRKILTERIHNYLRRTFAEIPDAWRYRLVEAGGQDDHIHLLVEIHPALNISTLINNLKSASSRRVRARFAKHIVVFYCKPYFWSRACHVGSVGNVTLETIRQYVQNQNTHEWPRKNLNPLLAPPSWLRLERGMRSNSFNSAFLITLYQ